MMRKKGHGDVETDLLKQVSRSFYLSMRVLPGPMRRPVSLGYLLARASDTLADTASAPVALRRDCLQSFLELLESPGADQSALRERLAREFVPLLERPGERELLARVGEVLDRLAALSPENREALDQVTAEILRGQAWDLERFGERGGSVETAEELETYAYRVAGCVGEFWTRTGLENLGRRFAPREAEGELMARGRALGQGLQLVNILRDLGEDLRAGRCYLPRAELVAAGWRGESWEENEAALERVAAEWRERCRAWLQQGSGYVALLRRGRVRAATALPLLLAQATLDHLDAAGGAVLRQRVKASRAETRRVMWRALRA